MENKIEIIAARRGYVVSDHGVAYNPKGDVIGKYINNGYHDTHIRVNHNVKELMIHRLQAYQKYGHKMFDKGVEVRHKDGNSLNNSWDNILIGTHSDNMLDIPKQIRIKRAAHATSFIRKFNKDKVKEFHGKNRSYKNTMEEFGITSKGTLNYILNNNI
ncbi:MAG: HNH endonuclease [Candidatus Marinimicrobia bacterium]|nr:HNH endonuclease [Candidatus Neomarinimicrobiota bacterium]